MNRERSLRGTNSYARELRLDPAAWLEAAATDREQTAWLDLCCGAGFALAEAAEQFQARTPPLRVEIVGVDLVQNHRPQALPPGLLKLVTGPLEQYTPSHTFDLITSVHGWHYLGDKLGLLQRALSWRTPNGLFVAHLDLSNLRHESLSPQSFRRQLLSHFRAAGIDYHPRFRRILARGSAPVRFPWRYLGADDQAGPNFTGQPAVDSWYGNDPSIADRVD